MPYSLLLLLVQAAPATPLPPPAAVVSSPTTLQGAFDAATAAYESGRWTDAVTAFDALEARLGQRAKPVVLAGINLRRGLALRQLRQNERAESSLRKAMSLIPPNDPVLGAERKTAEAALFALLLERSDFVGANRVAKDILIAATTPEDRLRGAILGMRATMFDAGDEALHYAEDAEKFAAALPKENKADLANVATLHARVLLSRGDAHGAYDLLKKALARQGGLDTRVNLNEVTTRFDLAMAALLNNQKDQAREYMAYTGAGRTAESPFATAVVMGAPRCGGAAGLQPDDVGIVEFGLDKDGAVSYAQTVYLSHRSPLAAKAFADAVLLWRWRPSEINKIPEFFKILTRVELRCTNAVARPSSTDPFIDAVSTLVSATLQNVPGVGLSSASLPAVRAELARRQKMTNDPAVPGLMLLIGVNAATPDDEKKRMYAASLAALPSDAPLALRAALQMGFDSSSSAAERRRMFRSILADPVFAADPVIASTLRLNLARGGFELRPPPDAVALVQAVIDDARLEKDDPLKTAALLQLANLQNAARQPEAAAATFARTGLAAEQCALLDTPPAMAKSNAGSTDFPLEAMRWGFEGWVRLEQDILANGRPTGTRAIIAYPPFVFRDAAVGMGSAFRYQTTFRPGSTIGCTANQQSIRFNSR